MTVTHTATAIPVVDVNTGRIHVLCNYNDGNINEEEIRAGKGTRKCYHMFSDDNGTTWFPPEDNTAYVKNRNGVGMPSVHVM
jgi:hypothetical protein